tara:strand:+ start:1433 stop:2278 length:846 start_codon:yes stop_codon:yes gene_type:complete
MNRLEDYNKTLPIAEIYTAVQSEGSRAGYPTVVIRTTGCTHRCYFGEGGWCDSWYTSIHPDKGTYSFNDIVKAYENNPHIKEMMLTGGSPTMHGTLVNELTHFANTNGIFITIETEGSHYLETDFPIDLLSISPKFSNSIPVLGVLTPKGKVTDEKMIKQHNKFRMNTEAIVKSIMYHKDFHIKPVWDGKDKKALLEIEYFIDQVRRSLIEKDYGASPWTDPLTESEVNKMIVGKVWFMPAGDSRESLYKSYPLVFDWVRDNGYRMTWRPHIIAFEDQREV